LNILGINEGHNSSAAIIKNGKLVAAVCEERFTRIKNDQGYPENAINFCLKEANINNNEIDYVATATLSLPSIFEASKRYSSFTIEDYVKENERYWKSKLIYKQDVDFFSIFPVKPNKHYDFSYMQSEPNREKWNDLFNEQRIKNLVKEIGISKEKIIFVDHHTGHAHYAYFMSPFRKDVLIITADAYGDGCNCSVWLANKNNLELKLKSPNHNLSRLYRNITLLLGMEPNKHEYKVMGLAAYATDHQIKKPYEIFRNTLCVDDINFTYKEKPTDHYFWFKERLEGCRFDGIAGGLQKYVEDVMEEWVKNLINTFKCTTIVFSGGFALNIKVNKKLSEMQQVENIFVPGGGGDESQSIGVALYVQNKFAQTIDFVPPIHDYLGPNINSLDIEKILENKKVSSEFKIKNNVSNKEIADHLSRDVVVARCTGKSEFGPRALGNRSILANPSKIKNIKKINEQIKYRDFWMPFAPSILIERAKDYVINPKNIASPFMTISFDSTKLAQKDLVAAIHPSDLTVRPQFVDKKSNPEFYELISEFEKITGIGALLNTSFNLHGEPIVNSFEDAIHTLINSDLDALVIGKTMIKRNHD